MVKVIAYNTSNPTLETLSHLIYDELCRHPRKIAFGGKAGAGKTEVCRLIAGNSILLPTDRFGEYPVLPILNHADLIKEEVLTWVAKAKTRGLIPGERNTFEWFCEFQDFPPGLVERELAETMMPVYLAMNDTLEMAYEYMPRLDKWADMEPGENIDAKVAMVDEYKTLFRTSLQRYGQAVKETTGNDYYWVEQTVNRSIRHKIALNGDTRFASEMEILENTGWTTIWLDISRETQKIRRPDLTDEQLAHVSENGLAKEDCKWVVDGNVPLGEVLQQVYAIVRPRAIEIPS